jgi:hypothetical protein
MNKLPEPTVFVPSEPLPALMVESSLGIDSSRFRHLGFIMDDIWVNNQKKADAIKALACTEGLTDTEKVYMGFKLYERFCRRKIPMWSTLEKLI